jgi:hypothetical protein
MREQRWTLCFRDKSVQFSIEKLLCFCVVQFFFPLCFLWIWVVLLLPGRDFRDRRFLSIRVLLFLSGTKIAKGAPLFGPFRSGSARVCFSRKRLYLNLWRTGAGVAYSPPPVCCPIRPYRAQFSLHSVDLVRFLLLRVCCSILVPWLRSRGSVVALVSFSTAADDFYSSRFRFARSSVRPSSRLLPSLPNLELGFC